jgi:hypothetical protein
MPTVAEALRQHAPAYLKKFGKAVPIGHRKVISAIVRCRTGELGGVAYRCDDCRRAHWYGRSCGNRHCPGCGADKTTAWLAKQTRRLMPVHHFLVTCTVPDRIGSVLRAHQREGYNALFDAGAASIRDVGAATKSLRGCQLGFFGVLHTWGRDPMIYHPHVHFVVPGGGVKLDEKGHAVAWQATPQNFLFHHETFIRVYKAKLADELRARGLYDAVPAAAWHGKFVVDMKPVGDGQAVLKYLAPYVHRVAISDKRIVAVDEQSVTFAYTPSGTNRAKTRRVTGEEFMRGFTQHVLPRGLQKVRHYGWMGANCRTGLDEVKWLIWLFLGWVYWLASGHAPQPEAAPRKLPTCPVCGGKMRQTYLMHRDVRALVDFSRAYLDSG